MNAKSLNLFVLRLLQVLFVVGIVCECLLPWIFKRLLAPYGVLSKGDFAAVLIPVMISGVFAILILFELARIMKTVVAGACFVEENVTSLHRLGIYAFIITCVMALRLVLFPTVAALVIVAVFLIAGLFSFVLERVFAEAVRYKEDDDLTI